MGEIEEVGRLGFGVECRDSEKEAMDDSSAITMSRSGVPHGCQCFFSNTYFSTGCTCMAAQRHKERKVKREVKAVRNKSRKGKETLHMISLSTICKRNTESKSKERGDHQ
ncbi:hypothetical protein ACFX1S_010884 [Malus domestica]